MQKPINVLYDIGILGGHGNKGNQTGIFRVIDNVARRLANSDQCRVVFCADSRQDAAAAYAASVPELAHTDFAYRHYKNRAVARYVRYGEVVETATGWKNLVARVGQKAAYMSIKSGPGETPAFQAGVLENGDVFHATAFSMPGQVRQMKHLKKFSTFYDLVPLLFPEWTVRRHIIDDMKDTLGRIGADDWAVAISQATKDDLCDHSKIRSDQVFVTPLAADPGLFHPRSSREEVAQVLKRYGIPDAPYVLSLSTLEVRKNIDHVIKSFTRLVREERIPDLNLVLAGVKGWSLEKIDREIDNAADLKGRIILPGYIDNQDLAALYGGALAFAYTSLYEGFGLPPLEAMQCGTPVVTSSTSSLPEVVGDAGILVDPRDEDALCQSLLSLYRDSELRRSMSRRSLERAKLFSWERCAQETINAYRSALSA